MGIFLADDCSTVLLAKKQSVAIWHQLKEVNHYKEQLSKEMLRTSIRRGFLSVEEGEKKR